MFTISQNKKMKSGFTLVETLVAISILLIAVVAPLMLLASDIQGIFSVKNNITALYLAEDAIDFMKYRLETNMNAQTQSGGSTPVWSQGQSGDTSPSGLGFSCNPACNVDSFNNRVTTCTLDANGLCTSPLQVDPITGAYGYTSGWTDTQFTRTITLRFDSNVVPSPPDTSANHEGVEINATISWNERGVAKQVMLHGYAYSWYGYLPY